MKLVHKNFTHILPPAPGLCQVCGSKHPPELPHNKGSLYYNLSFRIKHNRDPTWEDAMAHCSEPMKAAARIAIAEAEATLDEFDK